MTRRSNKRTKSLLIIVTALFLGVPGKIVARDINLDEIYIKKTSRYLSRLMIKKLDSYDKIKADLIDRNIIFSGWISGNDIVYLQEMSALGTNILYRYRVSSKKKTEICRITGTVTAFRVSARGNFVVVKRFVMGRNGIPRGGTAVCMIEDRRVFELDSGYGFLDFSITPDGYSLIHEDTGGIREFFPRTGRSRTLLAKDRYSFHNNSAQPTRALLSPDKKSLLVIHGGGGAYDGEVIQGNHRIPIEGISSTSEVYWIDRTTIIYRGGTPGYYSVNLFELSGRKRRSLLTRSYNTNITFSQTAVIVSFLKDQLLMFYIPGEGKPRHAGIEGEDASFSPSGKSFTVLLYGRLFVVNRLALQKYELELRKYWGEVYGEYRRLYASRSDWENQYSLDYIRRKMNLYKTLLSGNP